MYSVLIVDDEEPVLESYGFILEGGVDGFRLAGYCGIGQLVSGLENERISYAWALAQAKQRGDAKGIKAL
ncbi:MAG TPA: hypothetical protein PKO22_09480, partial [Treponemataceae bacterium]|nr:hypothetical protein [Treponemataceae bacterium]